MKRTYDRPQVRRLGAPRGRDGEPQDLEVADPHARAPLPDLKIDTSAAAQTGIVMTTPEGTVISVNDVLLRMWGFLAPADLQDRPIGVLFGSDKAAGILWRLLRSQGSFSCELDARRADGSHFIAHFSAHMVLGSDETPTRVMVTFVDVSAQREK